MSSWHDPKDGRWYLPNNELKEEERAILEMLFDGQVDDDSYSAERIIKEKKLLWRVCLIKTLVFVPEILLSYFLLEPNMTQDRVACQSIYWQYFRKRLTVEEFKFKMKYTLGVKHE